MHMGIEEQVSMTVDEGEILIPDSEADSSSTSSGRFGFLARNGMIRVEAGNNEHEIIQNCFLMGMGQFAKDTNVVAIHRNSCSGLNRQARFETFRIFSEAVAEKTGGDPNIKYAWYGASKNELCQIISHGFSQCRQPENRPSYGHGVHLSSVNFSEDGALSSVEDENGLSHMLLCRVILGNMEAVCAGSGQFQPSSMEFDSGVDNLSSPRRYIIWNAYMNSHIFPCHIISFKAPSSLGLQRNKASAVKPNSPYMRFPDLMSILAKHLHPSKMVLISKLYSDFQQKKIRRPQLIQRLRQIAGDELLTAVIKVCRDKKA